MALFPQINLTEPDRKFSMDHYCLQNSRYFILGTSITDRSSCLTTMAFLLNHSEIQYKPVDMVTYLCFEKYMNLLISLVKWC